MKNTTQLRNALANALGIGAAVVGACSLCCLPLLAPLFVSLLAGAGIYGYGDVLGIWPMGLATVAALALLVFWLVKRRSGRRTNLAAAESCACRATCKS